MVLFKTTNPVTFVCKIQFLEDLQLKYKIDWQSFYDGEYFSILVNREDGEIHK